MATRMKHLIERHRWWAVHAIRMIVAGVTTLAAVHALGLSVGLSAVVSAIAVTQSNIGGSLGKAFEQGVGSFLGAVVAAVVALSLRPDDPASTVLALALALAPLSALAAFSVGFQVAPITAAVVLLGGPGLAVAPDVLAAERLLGVALGSSVGILTGVLVLPARASRSAGETAARVAGLLAAQLHAIAPGDGTGEDALAARAGQIRRALSELAAEARDAARERRLSLGRGQDPVRSLRAQRRDGRIGPAGVHRTQARVFQEQRQARHPVHHLAGCGGAEGEFRQKASVLANVLGRMWTQRLTCLGMEGMEADRVQLVIAHDRARLSGIDEVARQAQDLRVLGSAVDEVAQEQDAAPWFGVDPARSAPAPAQPRQRRLQLAGLAVDVGDDVDRCHLRSSLGPGRHAAARPSC